MHPILRRKLDERELDKYGYPQRKKRKNRKANKYHWIKFQGKWHTEFRGMLFSIEKKYRGYFILWHTGQGIWTFSKMQLAKDVVHTIFEDDQYKP